MNFVVLHRSGGLSFHLFWFLQCIGIPLQWYQNHSSSSSLVWNEGWEDLMMVGLLFFSKDKEGREGKDFDENLHHFTHCSLLIVPVLFRSRCVFESSQVSFNSLTNKNKIHKG